MRKSRISSSKQTRLIEHFVAGTTARCASQLIGVNKSTAAYYFERLREIIAFHVEQEAHEVFDGEIEVDESYFGGTRKGKRGRPQLYSDHVILMALSIKNVFKLPLRATQGFLKSILKMMNLHLSVPNYTLLSKRAKTLEVPLLRLSKGENLDVVIDSTGLKIYGEGEWKVRTHGVSKRRTWRKIHLGVDPKSKEILASVITTNDVKDGEVLAEVLDQIPGALNMVALDGAYDEGRCYEAISRRLATPVIPPRKGARKGVIEPRNHAIQRIQETSLKEWKIEANYHKRSLAETTMFRYKTRAGLAAARARGRLGGRPRKMDQSTLKMEMTAMAGHKSVASDVAKRLGITTTTLYSYVNGDGSPKELGTRLLKSS